MITKEEMVYKLNKFFQEMADAFHLEMVFLYGSWARGYPRDDSDVDIAVVFSSEFPSLDEEFRLICKLTSHLSALLGKDVNVLSIKEDFNKPMLYYNAIVLGNHVYIRDFYKFIGLKLKSIFHMEDFSLFGTGWQLEVARKNLESLKHA